MGEAALRCAKPVPLMISTAYAQKMAADNAWMNHGIYEAASKLSDDRRREDCGAFFKSIHGTLNHLLWDDQIWMARLAGTPAPRAKDIPVSTCEFELFDELSRERAVFDDVICNLADELDPVWLEGTLN
jgi:uncharacterized damage-inducible protein DinB